MVSNMKEHHAQPSALPLRLSVKLNPVHILDLGQVLSKPKLIFPYLQTWPYSLQVKISA